MKSSTQSLDVHRRNGRGTLGSQLLDIYARINEANERKLAEIRGEINRNSRINEVNERALHRRGEGSSQYKEMAQRFDEYRRLQEKHHGEVLNAQKATQNSINELKMAVQKQQRMMETLFEYLQVEKE